MKLKKHQKIAIVMGSQSDYSTMKDCVKILKSLKISFDVKIVSAHRTPKRLYAVSYTHLTLPTKAYV